VVHKKRTIEEMMYPEGKYKFLRRRKLIRLERRALRRAGFTEKEINNLMPYD